MFRWKGEEGHKTVTEILCGSSDGFRTAQNFSQGLCFSQKKPKNPGSI